MRNFEGNVAKHIQEEDLRAIEEVVRTHPEHVNLQQISKALKFAPPRRTLQYRLKALVEAGRLLRRGSGRSTRYGIPGKRLPADQDTAGDSLASVQPKIPLPLSEPGAEIQEYVRRPTGSRGPTGYNQEFLLSYKPNDTFYLSATERMHLHEVGGPQTEAQPAGTYAKKILNRLLSDLAWNSSRLEGNTYSLLDTIRLLELGKEAEGKDQHDAQMILNHKDAIEFLVDSAKNIGFNRYTILNLHAALADNLLADPSAPGRLRRINVGIGGSVFYPLELPQRIEECFNHILATAEKIDDPFEQAFFAMVQIPYLQPFDDVNKRVSRLAANIPLIKGNLSPLSFEDVPRDIYTESVLGVYELNRTELFRDVFIWAYERSAARYVAVRQSLGDPDPFRMRHRESLRSAVGEVVRRCMDKKQATVHVGTWARENIGAQGRERFQEIAEQELMGLHEGNFARYRIGPSEFQAWQRRWGG